MIDTSRLIVVFKENRIPAVIFRSGLILLKDKSSAKMKAMTQDFLQKALYELLYNNVLLPRTHEIDREEEREAFDGSTKSSF